MLPFPQLERKSKSEHPVDDRSRRRYRHDVCGAEGTVDDQAMTVGLIVMLSGIVMLYLAIVGADLKTVADQFLQGNIVKRSFK